MYEMISWQRSFPCMESISLTIYDYCDIKQIIVILYIVPRVIYLYACFEYFEVSVVQNCIQLLFASEFGPIASNVNAFSCEFLIFPVQPIARWILTLISYRAKVIWIMIKIQNGFQQIVFKCVYSEGLSYIEQMWIACFWQIFYSNFVNSLLLCVDTSPIIPKTMVLM